MTRGASDTTYGPVSGTNVVNNTTFQTGPGSQSVICSLGCGRRHSLALVQRAVGRRKSHVRRRAVRLGRNLVWNSSGQPFAQIAGRFGHGPRRGQPEVRGPRFQQLPRHRGTGSRHAAADWVPDLHPITWRRVSKLRILDTRPYHSGRLQRWQARRQATSLPCRWPGVADVPTSGVAAVTMNLVLTESSGSGFVTAWPSGQPRPNASNINVEGVGSTISTLVTVPMGADGKVSIFTQSGGHLVADVAGWLPTGTFVASNPTRILDTRPGPEQLRYSGDRPGAGAVIDLQVGWCRPGACHWCLGSGAEPHRHRGRWRQDSSRSGRRARAVRSRRRQRRRRPEPPPRTRSPCRSAPTARCRSSRNPALISLPMSPATTSPRGGFNALMPTQDPRHSPRWPTDGVRRCQTRRRPDALAARARPRRRALVRRGIRVLNLTATDGDGCRLRLGLAGRNPAPDDIGDRTSPKRAKQGPMPCSRPSAPMARSSCISQSGTDLVVDVTGWLPS